MGLRLTKTDNLGRFHFDTLTFNRALAKKSAFIMVFKPGWLPYAGSSAISSSLVAISPTVHIELTRGPGDTMRMSYDSQSLPSRLQDHERTFSGELFGTERTVVEAVSRCGPQGLSMATAAMAQALDIASTFEERERVHAACLYANDAIKAPGHDWPFDCEHLPFKKPVSADVLAVEAEVANARRIRRERSALEETRGCCAKSDSTNQTTHERN